MSNELTIREATLADIPTIQGIAGIAFPETYKDIITREQCDYMMEMMYSTASLRRQMTEEHHTYLLCYCGSKAAGYVSVQPMEANVYELQKIYVLPEMQGKHIGKFLFGSAIDLIKRVHPQPCRVELHVNRHNKAIGFYEHMGMTRLREGDYAIGGGFYMNDYIMGMEV